MKKLLSRLLWVPLGLAFAVFLVANRQPVAISFDPVSPTDPAVATYALPLWVWLMTFLLLGIGLGAFGSWLSGRGFRSRARDDRQALRRAKMASPARAVTASGAEAPLLTAEK